MLSAPIITGRTCSGRPVYTVTVTGVRAAAIESAYRASFYGIKKLWPSVPECTKGMHAADDAVHEAITDAGLEWNSYYILRGRVIDTSGTPVPYKAEIDFTID